jgi:hypothetical protein
MSRLQYATAGAKGLGSARHRAPLLDTHRACLYMTADGLRFVKLSGTFSSDRAKLEGENALQI